MNHTKMTPSQDPDEFLYIAESCRDHLNTSTPPEGFTNRQYENIVARLQKYLKSPFQRRDLVLADI